MRPNSTTTTTTIAMERTEQAERLAKGANSVMQYAGLVVQHTERAQWDSLLQPARQQVREYARLQVELQASARALQRLKDQLVEALTSGAEVDLEALPSAVLRDAEQEAAAAAPLDSHPTVAALQQQLAEAAPPAADGDGDEELRMTRTVGAALDPWSKQAIRRPFKNQRCGHLYELESLERVLGPSNTDGRRDRRKKRPPHCPYVGCANQTPLTWEDLVEDLAARQLIENQAAK